MRTLGKLALRGLMVVLPIGLTLYILWWLGAKAEALMALAVPEGIYVPGMGLVLGLALILVIGLLTQAWLARKLFSWGEDLIEKLPLVKTIYGSVKDLMSLFGHSGKGGMSQVVTVEFSGNKMLGLVTRESAAAMTGDEEDEDLTAVYLPMGYQIGGFMVLVPKSSIRPLDMDVGEGLRLAVTAGLSAHDESDDAALPA